MYVRVETEVRPTEDIEKVKKAVSNVFVGELRIIEKGNGYYIVEGESYSARSLLRIHELIRIQRIMDAARKKLQSGTMGSSIVFKLHKQAALAGKLSFIDNDNESPLGPITFYIETSDPMKLIDWLAPKTSMGKPLWEIEMPED